MPDPEPGPPAAPRLARRLGLADAVVLGLGSMVGAGIFAAVGPAAAAAGSGLLVGLGVAALVAYANATASAQLAARYPEAGGTYVYGARLLGPFWGYLAGWGFLVGKTASLAAMAMTVGAYALPGHAKPVGVAAVVAMTAVNYVGVEKTARTTRVIITVVLGVLAALVVAAVSAPGADLGRLAGTMTPRGVLESAGLLFFAFAGYARIATLGEEVRDPETVIPKAIPLALGLALTVYALVTASALIAVGPEELARSDAPLATAAASAGSWVEPLVRVGGAVAALGVLLSLLAGVSRTTLAMARDRNLPHWLASVNPRFGTPHRAELLVALAVVSLVVVVDLRGAIGFSSFAILAYYAIANASAFRQPPQDRRWPRALQLFGVAGCALLALSLPPASVAGGVAVLAIGSVVWVAARRSADAATR